MLLGRISDLHREIDDLKNLRDGRRTYDSFRARRDFLRALRESLEAVAVDVARLKTANIVVDVASPQGLRQALEALRQRVSNDPDALIAPDPVMRRLLSDDPSALARGIRAQLLTQWADYVDTVSSQGNRELLGLLAQIPSLQAEMVALEGKWQAVNAARGQLPSNAGELRRPAELVEEVTKLMSALKLDGVPTEVRVFLSRLREGGATFDDYTEVVRDWCREHDVEKSLRIRVQS
jgi:uncharacterized protein YgfB (UPF0149 family)